MLTKILADNPPQDLDALYEHLATEPADPAEVERNLIELLYDLIGCVQKQNIQISVMQLRIGRLEKRRCQP